MTLMELVIDFHLHSRFSHAVSPRMDLQNMYIWGRKKGLNILSVADFTHSIWLREVQAQIEEEQDGIYAFKRASVLEEELSLPIREEDLGMHFIFSTEVACIYGGRVKDGVSGSYRIHNLILSPNLETVIKINKEFQRRGFNLSADGRPILGISARNLAELLFSIDRKIVIIPCHIWTPWFSVYGSKGGYDRISDCYGEFSKYIFAVETGLSSDPSMNWRVNELSSRSIVSFSDAHSLEKMGREATVLKLKTENQKLKTSDITYSNIMNGLVRGKERVFEIGYTIEFYPEEGKYHYTGHRNCNVVLTPQEEKKNGKLCPVCKRELTGGVMGRVEELSNMPSNNFKEEQDAYGVSWIKDIKGERPPFVNLVPLLEILAEALNSSVSTQAVKSMYDNLIAQFGSEHDVLLRSSLEKIQTSFGVTIAESIQRVRERNINIIPGFDNTYGVVEIWGKQDSFENKKKEKEQLGFGF